MSSSKLIFEAKKAHKAAIPKAVNTEMILFLRSDNIKI
jgi:hypothetical protein